MKKEDKLKAVENLFQEQHVADMKELQKVLGTTSRVTVFRYLRQLNYITSFTHSARYYSLPTIAQFDQDGLWYRGDIGFSKHGTLLNTLIHFVTQSEAGKTNAELERQFRIRVQNSLLKLLKTNKIGREILIKKTYLYVSSDPNKRKKQIKTRKKRGGKERISDWDIIEILIETIRISSASVSAGAVANNLRKRGSSITRNQVEQVFQEYGLEKKTLDYLPSNC